MSTTIRCATCGKSIQVKESHAERRKTCSRECRSIFLRTNRQKEIEHEFNEPIYSLLTRLYCIEQLGIKQIAKRLKVSDRNLWEWFNDFGIERRDRSKAVALQWQHNTERKEQASQLIQELVSSGIIDNRGDNNPAKKPDARQKISKSKLGKRNWMYKRRGKLHHMWTGGKIYYYGATWPEQRNAARERDNYTCQRCEITETELGRQLDVHHIVKFRYFGIEQHEKANKLSNLICFCTSCHHIVEHETNQVEQDATNNDI